MYTRMLIPLDGSKLAEQVLPYARSFAKRLRVGVELLAVVDPEPLAVLSNPEQGRPIDTLVAENVSVMRTYLGGIAQSFNGVAVQCSIEKGKAEEAIIEKAAADKNTLILMATHGRSGIQRWLLGSVADKVLHGGTNPMLLVRATEQGKTYGEALLRSIIVPLDGSVLAEKVLPEVTEIAKQMNLEVILTRAYALPTAVGGEDYGSYAAEFLEQLENGARDYLQEKAEEIKQRGVEKVSLVVHIGYGAEEIITLARQTPDNLIAMCTHGRSGIKRWVLGSVTERVVSHAGDPVLIIRGG